MDSDANLEIKDYTISELKKLFSLDMNDTKFDIRDKLKFLEERVKTCVSEVIDGQDGISVQANLITKRVDGLVQGLQGLIQE